VRERERDFWGRRQNVKLGSVGDGKPAWHGEEGRKGGRSEETGVRRRRRQVGGTGELWKVTV